MDGPLLSVEGLAKHFLGTGRFLAPPPPPVRAVDGVSFDIAPGRTLGLVGESGCGKSTVGRSVLRLVEPTAGRVRLEGEDVGALSGGALRRARARMQMVFQDPFSSLNPRMRAADIVAEPLRNYGAVRGRALRDAVGGLFERVGLRPDQMERYPHQFSGGQRQRLGIARALALKPKLIVCDEAVSALDVSVQAQVINLLVELQAERALSYLFISHDLAVVRHIADRVAVMYLGKIVEIGAKDPVFRAPAHPYTRALMEAAPVPVPGRRTRALLTGDIPSPANPPPGCRFHTRCPIAVDRCRAEEPLLRPVGPDHRAACHLAETSS